MAVHPYYTDPRTGRRTTRDDLVRLLGFSQDRVVWWQGERDRWLTKAEGARSQSWATRFLNEMARAQKYRDRAAKEGKALQEAIDKGDGANKDWQYRLSVNYTQAKGKQGDWQRVNVDLIFEAPKRRRASSDEVRKVFRHFFHHGTTTEGWKVRAVTWHHATNRKRSPASPDQDQVRTEVAGPDGIDQHVRTIFRKVFNADAGRETVDEERIAGHRGRRRWVLGEEEG